MFTPPQILLALLSFAAAGEDTGLLDPGPAFEPTPVAVRVMSREEDAAAHAPSVTATFSLVNPGGELLQSDGEASTTLGFYRPPMELIEPWLAPGGPPAPRTARFDFGEAGSITADVLMIDQQPTGSVSWVGVPQEDPMGLVVITWAQGAWYGDMRTREVSFSLRSAPGDLVEVRQHHGPIQHDCSVVAGSGPRPSELLGADPGAVDAGAPSDTGVMVAAAAEAVGEGVLAGSEGDPEVALAEEGPIGEDRPEGPICGYPADGNTVDLLMIWSLGGWNDAGFAIQQDAVAMSGAWVAWANASFAQSGVDARINLVGADQLDVGDYQAACGSDSVPLGGIQACLDGSSSGLYGECTTTIGPAIATLLSYRAFVGADLVHVVTDGKAPPGCFATPGAPSFVNNPVNGVFDDNAGEAGGVSTGMYHWDLSDPTCVGPQYQNMFSTHQFPNNTPGWNSFLHETGHNLGGNHHSSEGSGGSWGTLGTFGDNVGYIKPATPYFTNAALECDFSTIMAYNYWCNDALVGAADMKCAERGAPCICGAATGPWSGACPANLNPANDIHLFSSSCIESGEAQDLAPIGDDAHDMGRVLPMTVPVVAAIRQHVSTWYDRRSVLIAPSPGALDPVVSPQDFKWTKPDPGATNVVEFGRDIGQGDCLSAWSTTGDSVTVTFADTTCRFLRLWTNVPNALPGGVSRWALEDVEFNARGVVSTAMMMDFPTTPALLDCANWGDRTASGNLHDPYWMARAVPWDMASRDCFGTCGYVAGGTPADIVCDLEQGVPAPTVTPWAVATSLTGLNAGPNQFVYGVNRSNQAFCCAYSEYRAAANQVDAVLMRGTEIGDRVRFHQCGGQDLRGITNAPFSIELRGMGGDDVLFGSDAAAGVSELIDGGDGADVIYGKGGDDLLRGGDGADVMHGGAGVDDVHGQGGSDHLQGGAGLDYLYGEGLPDYVCDEGDADELYGGGGLDLLAWRPVAGNPSVGIGDGQTSGANCFLFGLPWASNCVLGHTTWSTSCLDHWDLP